MKKRPLEREKYMTSYECSTRSKEKHAEAHGKILVNRKEKKKKKQKKIKWR